MFEWKDIPIAFLTGGFVSICAALFYYGVQTISKKAILKISKVADSVETDYFEELLNRARMAQEVGLHDASLIYSVSSIIADLRSLNETSEDLRRDVEIIRASGLPSELEEEMMALYQKRNIAAHAGVEKNEISNEDSDAALELAIKIHRFKHKVGDS